MISSTFSLTAMLVAFAAVTMNPTTCDAWVPSLSAKSRMTTTHLSSTPPETTETPPPPYTEPLMDFPATKTVREHLIDVCQKLKQENGLVVIEKSSKDELKEAVEALESMTEPPSLESNEEIEHDMLGPWTLLATTSTSRPGIDKSKLPKFLFDQMGPLQQLRDNIREAANKYITVQQIVKTSHGGANGEEGVIDRIDHVIEYKPPKHLQDLIDNLPEAITNLDINPLGVSKSKLVLVHDASVIREGCEDNDDFCLSDALKTKLTLKSVVLNVAGTSTLLDPEGQDLIGFNLPLSEFIGANTPAGKAFSEFETTYMDHDLRISRSKGNGLVDDQLRVFIRTKDSDDDDSDNDDEAVAVKAELLDEHDGQDDVSPSDY